MPTLLMRLPVPRWAALIALLAITIPGFAQIPSPAAHFGHPMGQAGTLIEWNDLVRYFQRVDAASDRLRVDELGRTTEGRPLILVTIADPKTLANLDRYKQIQAGLADPRRTNAGAADVLIEQGKTVVLITCSIHSTEVASTHTAVEFAHKLLTEDTPRHRAILRDTIFLLVPSLNPDGVDKVASWYKRYLGTPYEGAPMIELYQKYVGHDNNRDWYIFSQQETRLAVEKIHNVWRPQIVYDVHQMDSNGARMFVPPWSDPVDPNIDPLILQQGNQIGTAMAADLTAAGKTGVVVNAIYDYFTPARHYQSYHGGLRLLSEAASARYATPIETPFSSLTTNGRGYNAQARSWNFPEPWLGGKWTMRDIIDYQLITFETCLYQAALQRPDLLRNFRRISQRVMARNRNRSFILPRDQHDPSGLRRLLETLEFGMVEIQSARRRFRAAERTFQEGDYVVSLDQPYGAFAKTLLERQDYPERREYPGGPPVRPYDVTAHSLPLLMGVDVYESREALTAELQPLKQVSASGGRVAAGYVVALSPDASDAWIAVNRLLKAGADVFRDTMNGTFYITRRDSLVPMLEELAKQYGLDFRAASPSSTRRKRMRTARVGLYAGFVPIMDEGWTRWVLDQYEFPHESVGNARLQAGDLNSDFDVIILPDARPRTLHGGYLPGALYAGAPVPAEYTGGIGAEGATALRDFVTRGGTLLALNQASEYAIDRLRVPVRNALGGLDSSRFYAPGSQVRVTVDTSHPLAFGLREEESVWFESGPAFETSTVPNEDAMAVMRYPGKDILASGWLLGEGYLANQAAVLDTPIGNGHLVLFGIRPQYRGQSNATFKMLFNGLYYTSP
ncbi:MAG: M14 family metallopeptidase [Acidobacteria bacterium]|nr:M14 family metallopeptidase [Acidobacteriota bacterium]